MFLSEEENFTDFHNTDVLIWCVEDLTFGSWTDGPHKDGSRVSSIVLDVPEVIIILSLTAIVQYSHKLLVSSSISSACLYIQVVLQLVWLQIAI